MTSHVEIMTAGAPPSPTVIKNMEEIGANVTQTYGLTEVYGPFSICEWQSRWNTLPAEEKAKIKSRQGVPFITALYMDVVDSETMAPVPHDGHLRNHRRVFEYCGFLRLLPPGCGNRSGDCAHGDGDFYGRVCHPTGESERAPVRAALARGVSVAEQLYRRRVLQQNCSRR